MAWYMWYQRTGSNEDWALALADQRDNIIREKKPQFVTVLNLDHTCSNGTGTDGAMTLEDWSGIHYNGPLYFDFDTSSIDEGIVQFRLFLRKLQTEFNFDLSQGEYFCSGSKGFHIIIPEACFLAKPSARGYQYLPQIYKEMAMSMYVDTLDLRVYSARRGRQFRVANVERADKPGKYKVPISVDEALTITAEQYAEFVKGPRFVQPPKAPTLNTELALQFQVASDKVHTGFKNRKKSKVDQNFLASVKDNGFGPTISAIMKGENLKEGVGFQHIAVQLAIVANAADMGEDEFVAACAGLCENHQSDGNRYNTVEKRRVELRRMWAYMKDSPDYAFSIGGVKSLIVVGTKTPDLEPVVPGAELDEGEERHEDDIDGSLTQGMRISKSGIFRRTEEGVIRKVCAVGLANPTQLLDVTTGDAIGYEVDTYVDGKKKGRNTIDMSTFLSRTKFMQFTLSAGGSSMSATDPQIGALADILRARATRNDAVVYTTSREGVDVVLLPDGSIDTVWADQNRVISSNNLNYRLIGSRTADPQFKTDIYDAPKLEDSPAAREFFRHFFQLNRPDVIARIFGWMLACFFTQHLRHLFSNFPYLQVFGPAGSGKSTTMRLMAHLHYYKKMTALKSALDISYFALEVHCSSSGSIPFLLDEYKPRQMRKDRHAKIKGIVKGNWDGSEISKGVLSSDTGVTKLDLRSVLNRSPIVLIGEAMETETAMLERAVTVSINKEGKRGHTGDLNFCWDNRHILSQFGRTCIDWAMSANMDALQSGFRKYEKELSGLFEDRSDDISRPLYAISTVLAGLEFGRRVMSKIFDGEFDADFERLRNTIVADSSAMVPRVVSEPSKVLDTLSFLSRSTDDERMKLAYGIDYLINGDSVELRLRECYTKYVRYIRTLGEEPLYDNYDAFVSGMSHYAATTDRQCIDSLLKDSASTQVFQLSKDIMAAEYVGEFRSSN